MVVVDVAAVAVVAAIEVEEAGAAVAEEAATRGPDDNVIDAAL